MKTVSKLPARDSRKKLDQDVISCARCPRLRAHCQKIAREKKKSHADEIYWGLPVPDFGDPKASLLILGLAPAAHGANRTGRMFTGDRSGLWLYRALFRAGFANKESSEHKDDGLKLRDALITAVAHCAPPDNKPLPEEIENCSEYLVRNLDLVKPKVILALGSIAWNAAFAHLKTRGQWTKSRPAFSHLCETRINESLLVIGSYHPSQQNTFTGRLTEDMFDAVFDRARRAIEER